MVAEAQNTTVAIMRGVSYNSAGDLQDAATEVTGGIPAILAETSHVTFDPATQTPRTVRSATCKVPFWAGISDNDQIKDQATGRVYAVIDIEKPPTLTASPVGGPVDILLTLRRVTAAGT